MCLFVLEKVEGGMKDGARRRDGTSSFVLVQIGSRRESEKKAPLDCLMARIQR